ncbi:MAG: RNA methyltransferase [Thermomicrobiales bacterium]|nr:MAG: RNA methyltransferase [Thermomicrobiales bacterium]
MHEVLERRQPDLTVVLENVHDPHNIAAVLRSCDAVGAMNVHITRDPATKPHKKFSRRSSGSAATWIEVSEFPSIVESYAALRLARYTIVATGGGPSALSMGDLDLTGPVAIVLGNEMRGLTDEALAGADKIVTIPMVGMIRSLNISVACAVLLYEAFRQRDAAGLYTASRLSPEQVETFAIEWEKR